MFLVLTKAGKVDIMNNSTRPLHAQTDTRPRNVILPTQPCGEGRIQNKTEYNNRHLDIQIFKQHSSL